MCGVLYAVIKWYIGTKSLFATSGQKAFLPRQAGRREKKKTTEPRQAGPAGDGFVKKYFLAKFLLKIAYARF